MFNRAIQAFFVHINVVYNFKILTYITQTLNPNLVIIKKIYELSIL